MPHIALLLDDSGSEYSSFLLDWIQGQFPGVYPVECPDHRNVT